MNGQSFAGYFNSINKLNRKIKWVFGNSDKYIQVDSLELDVEGTDDSDNDYQSSFMDNIFSLGDGTNYFDFYLDFDDHYRIQDSIRERLRAKGLKFKILGGSGADHIEVDISTDDKVDLSSRSSFVANTKGGRDTIEVDSYFQLSAKIDSGSGSDTVDLCTANIHSLIQVKITMLSFLVGMTPPVWMSLSLSRILRISLSEEVVGISLSLTNTYTVLCII